MKPFVLIVCKLNYDVCLQFHKFTEPTSDNNYYMQIIFNVSALTISDSKIRVAYTEEM